MEPRQRASQEQFLALLDFMERNGDLSKPQEGPQGKIASIRLWQELGNMLNSIGGGVQKPVAKWKKVWADWKTKTKKKGLLLQAETSGTGGGPSRGTGITTLEERVLAIVGNSSINGLDHSEEMGGLNVGHDLMPNWDRAPEETQNVELPLVYLNSATPPTQTISAAPTPEHNNELPLVYNNISDSAAVPPPAQTLPAAVTPAATPAAAPIPAATSAPAAAVPTRGRRRRRHNSSASPSSPRRHRHSPSSRRYRMTPFERTAVRFSDVEERRLELERQHDQQRINLEAERLRLEAERLRLEAERLRLEEVWLRVEEQRVPMEAQLAEVFRQHNALVQELIAYMRNNNN